MWVTPIAAILVAPLWGCGGDEPSGDSELSAGLGSSETSDDPVLPPSDVDVCQLILEPVCGVDGMTYSNACFAEVAGVEVAYVGECGAPCDDASQVCPDDEFCDYPLNSCGAQGAVGSCRAIPEVCPDVWSPVCGCDGETYGNACEAQAAGTDVVHGGPCGEPPRCGGWSIDTCRPDEFCYHPFEACSTADGPGECRPRPEACPDLWEPVCGCDGETYSNRCAAQMNGVDRAYDGACAHGG
ncbi:MAG: Kazal-type serine protease inhibitor domain-containing protein [Myxococcota bacterium]